MDALAAPAALGAAQRLLRSQRRRGLRPAALDARVDRADVALHQHATALDGRVGVQPRAARLQRFGGPLGHQRQVQRVYLHGDVACAQHDGVHGFGGHLRHQFGAQLQLGAQHLARQLHGGARDRLRGLGVERAELAVEGFEQGADLRRRLLREALLEALQRHQAVAVAFLVAALSRRADAVLPFGGGRHGRLGRARRGAGGGADGTGRRCPAASSRSRPAPRAE